MFGPCLLRANGNGLRAAVESFHRVKYINQPPLVHCDHEPNVVTVSSHSVPMKILFKTNSGRLQIDQISVPNKYGPTYTSKYQLETMNDLFKQSRYKSHLPMKKDLYIRTEPMIGHKEYRSPIISPTMGYMDASSLIEMEQPPPRSPLLPKSPAGQFSPSSSGNLYNQAELSTPSSISQLIQSGRSSNGEINGQKYTLGTPIPIVLMPAQQFMELPVGTQPLNMLQVTNYVNELDGIATPNTSESRPGRLLANFIENEPAGFNDNQYQQSNNHNHPEQPFSYHSFPN